MHKTAKNIPHKFQVICIQASGCSSKRAVYSRRPRFDSMTDRSGYTKTSILRSKVALTRPKRPVSYESIFGFRRHHVPHSLAAYHIAVLIFLSLSREVRKWPPDYIDTAAAPFDFTSMPYRWFSFWDVNTWRHACGQQWCCDSKIKYNSGAALDASRTKLTFLRENYLDLVGVICSTTACLDLWYVPTRDTEAPVPTAPPRLHNCSTAAPQPEA